MKKVWEFFENLDEYVYVTDDRIFFRIINETKKSCAQITGNQFP